MKLAVLIPLALCQCLDGSTQGTARPLSPRELRIASTPVALDTAAGGRMRLGALEYLGGWRLESATRVFGGLSGLHVRNGRATAISDIGALVSFRVGRFGNIGDARIAPLPDDCGSITNKYANDAESLTTDGTRWWIGFEWHNAICRSDVARKRGEALVRPLAMRGWHRRRGPETLLRLRDGRFLVIAEERRSDTNDHAALLFDRDPTATGARALALGFVPPEGYAPVDAAQLPDGGLLVLTRRFALDSLFTAKLVRVDRLPARPGARFAGRTIASFAAPVITDNLEGVATDQENGRTIVWLVSDDNFQRWQRTLLLKFALD